MNDEFMIRWVGIIRAKTNYGTVRNVVKESIEHTAKILIHHETIYFPVRFLIHLWFCIGNAMFARFEMELQKGKYDLQTWFSGNKSTPEHYSFTLERSIKSID